MLSVERIDVRVDVDDDGTADEDGNGGEPFWFMAVRGILLWIYCNWVLVFWRGSIL